MANTIINLEDGYRIIVNGDGAWELQQDKPADVEKSKRFAKSLGREYKLKTEPAWKTVGYYESLAAATKRYINEMMKTCGADSFEDLLDKMRAVVDAACIPSITIEIK